MRNQPPDSGHATHGTHSPRDRPGCLPAGHPQAGTPPHRSRQHHHALPIPGTGSFTAIGEVISVRQADGNTIVAATEVQALAGLLTGGLAGLHLQGTFQPMVTSATTAEGTYSIQFHFDS